MKSVGEHTAPPMRLRLEAAPGSTLEQALNQACARGPSDEQMRALESAVLGALGSAGAASVVAAAMRAGRTTAKAAPSTAGLSITSTKVVVGLALAAVTAAGVWAWRRPATTVATPVSASIPLTGEPVEPPAAALLAPLIAAPRPAIAPARPRHAPANTGAAAIKEPARTPAHPAADDAPVAKPVGTPADDSEELRLLSRAHSALALDPAFALTLAHEHRRRFPSGSMDQEREVIAVSALMALGRVDDARQAADRFARDHAGSAYVARIHAIVTPRTAP